MLYWEGIYLLTMRMGFNLNYVDMDYHYKTKTTRYNMYTLHKNGLYPDFALISQNWKHLMAYAE